MSEVEDTHRYDIVDVGFIAVMSPNAAAKALNDMFNQWNITSTADKQLMKNSLLVWFAMNGASPRADYNGVPPITIHGNDYRLSVVMDVIGADMRKFARAYADDIKTLLKIHRGIANQLADKHDVQPGLGHVCFDVSDYCSDNTAAEKKVIADLKRVSISTSSKYSLVRNKHEKLNTGVPPTGAAAAPTSYFGDENEY
jgi:hypothetical protein